MQYMSRGFSKAVYWMFDGRLNMERTTISQNKFVIVFISIIIDHIIALFFFNHLLQTLTELCQYRSSNPFSPVSSYFPIPFRIVDAERDCEQPFLYLIAIYCSYSATYFFIVSKTKCSSLARFFMLISFLKYPANRSSSLTSYLFLHKNPPN